MTSLTALRTQPAAADPALAATAGLCVVKALSARRATRSRPRHARRCITGVEARRVFGGSEAEGGVVHLRG